MSRPSSDPTFFKMEAEIQRLQRVFSELNVLFGVKGQWANNALSSTEEFSVGGMNYGRGFDSSEIIGDDGIRRCAIMLDDALVRTATARKRPFQGWRYLKPEDAPPDLGQARQDDDALPPELAGALAEIGVL